MKQRVLHFMLLHQGHHIEPKPKNAKAEAIAIGSIFDRPLGMFEASRIGLEWRSISKT